MIIEVSSPASPSHKLFSDVKFFGYLAHPTEFTQDSYAGRVFRDLGICFLRGGTVRDGSYQDIVTGFFQSGWPYEHVCAGLQALESHGYVKMLPPPDLSAGMSMVYFTAKYYSLVCRTKEEAAMPGFLTEKDWVDRLETVNMDAVIKDER